MSLIRTYAWQIGSGAVVLVLLGAAVLWLRLRKRPTAEELERARRDFLVQWGRIVDGTVLDVYEVDAVDGRTLTMLLYNYRVAGVDYECSQDISALRGVVEATDVRLAFPCSVRYQPGYPQNSIVIAENWSALGFRACRRSRIPTRWT